MKLYVASSWKNPLYESTCAFLKEFGHEPLHIYIPVWDGPDLMWKMANSINFTLEELVVSLDR